ncbi:MAG TPA: zinc ribbon domain-containing protein [Luteitalea sp.]|nr:zinc ribbon domain-containing protein [Luteitalea sp.]
MTSIDARGARAWHFFIVLGLLGATAAVWREPRYTRPEHLVLLSIAIVASAFAALALHRALLPLVSPERVAGDARRSARQIQALEREKSLVLRSIKELEFDKAMGKVAEPDFDDMAGRLRQRAVGLMQRIDAGEAGLRERIARDLEGLRPGKAHKKADARRCAACETTNDADARFCKSCGAAL